MKLYGYWRSSATYRIRIVLALKEIPFEYHPVNLLKAQQSSKEFLANNPQGLVPALETDDGHILTQSTAICDYLEELFSERSLLPGTAVQRAQIRAVTAAIACEAQPLMNLRVQNYLKNEGGFDAEQMSHWLETWPGRTMRDVETLIAGRSGPFAFGEVPTLADAFIVPQVFAATRFGMDMTACPRLVAIADHCNTLSAFKIAHPANQPDAVTA